MDSGFMITKVFDKHPHFVLILYSFCTHLELTKALFNHIRCIQHQLVRLSFLLQ